MDTCGLASGSSGQLVLRPESLRLGSGAGQGAGGNTLGARVLSRQYLGAKTSYRVVLDSGLELRVEDAGAAPYVVGEAVLLGVDTASRVVAA